MLIRIVTIYVIFFLFLPLDSWGRPVSYPEGWTTMMRNNAHYNSLYVHYSPSASYALGYRLEYQRKQHAYLHTLQANRLLKRWNNKESQANLYLSSGIGIAYDDPLLHASNIGAVAFMGMEADWENRRFFIGYKNRYVEMDHLADHYTHSLHMGIAPYIGDYGDLHSWLMLEIDHQPTAHDLVTITPMIRLFKNTHLVEAGINNQGRILFNWIIRY